MATQTSEVIAVLGLEAYAEQDAEETFVTADPSRLGRHH